MTKLFQIITDSSCDLPQSLADELDLRDIDGIRKWYTASLTGMERLLTLLRESPALAGAGAKE